MPYGAVSPTDGRFLGSMLTQTNSECMQVFLNEVALRYPNNNIVTVLDGAGCQSFVFFAVQKKLHVIVELKYDAIFRLKLCFLALGYTDQSKQTAP